MVELDCRETLTPTLGDLEEQALHLNEVLRVDASGLLLGDGEGQSSVVVEGCFLRSDLMGPCSEMGTAVTGMALPATVVNRIERLGLELEIASSVFGIHAGIRG